MKSIAVKMLKCLFLFLLIKCTPTPEDLMLECKISAKSKVVQGRAVDVRVSVLPKDSEQHVSGTRVFINEVELVAIDSFVNLYTWETKGYDEGIHSLKVVMEYGDRQSTYDDFIIELVAYESVTSITDARDGNEYKVVEIGEQLWMAENLRYEHEYGFPVGSNNQEINMYGYLYLTKYGRGNEACPSEWHLPSPDEWDKLIDNLGGVDVAGGKLKDTVLGLWKSPNEGASNESGFTALPAGSLSRNHEYEGFGETARFFSSQYGTYYFLDYQSEKIEKVVTHPYNEGYSIRCVRNY